MLGEPIRPNEPLHRPLLPPPFFQSTVPKHLLDHLTEQDRYVYDMLSRIEQKLTWSMDAIVETNANSVDVHRRLKRFEEARDMFKKPLIVLAALITLLTPVVLAGKEILDLWKSIK